MKHGIRRRRIPEALLAPLPGSAGSLTDGAIGSAQHGMGIGALHRNTLASSQAATLALVMYEIQRIQEVLSVHHHFLQCSCRAIITSCCQLLLRRCSGGHLEGEGADAGVPCLLAARSGQHVHSRTSRPCCHCREQFPRSAATAAAQQVGNMGVDGSQVQHGCDGGGAKARHHCHNAQHARTSLTVPCPRLGCSKLQRLLGSLPTRPPFLSSIRFDK